MINQQLVDFIKQQLQVGSTKEKISNQLLTNGWTLQDIEEGFRATVPPTITPPVSPYSGASYSQNTNPIKTAETQQQTFQPQVQQSTVLKIKNHSNKKLFFIILILLLLVGGVSAYYFKDSLVNLPIIKNLFPNTNIIVPQDIPTQTDETQVVTQTEQPDNTVTANPQVDTTDSSLSIYNDPNGLYSFSYPKGAEIEYGGKYPGIWMTIPQWENNPIITIFSDINNTWLNSSTKTTTSTPKPMEKNSFGSIDTYPAYKYNLPKSSLNDYSAIYVIDLGSYNNTNLSIVFTVITNKHGPNLVDQVEKIVKSFIINKNNIASAIKIMSAKLIENQNYSNDISVRENLKKILAPAEIYYEKSNSYAGFCKSSDYLEVTKSITKSIILNCKDSADAYAIMTPVSSGYWCVDSTGYNNNASLKNTTTSCVK
jgi:hypothetical protein